MATNFTKITKMAVVNTFFKNKKEKYNDLQKKKVGAYMWIKSYADRVV